jgi:hypothetical protein
MPSNLVHAIAVVVVDKSGINKINNMSVGLELAIELFLALSRPLRRQARAFLRTQRAMLNAQLQSLSSQALKGNALAQAISVIESELKKVTSPVDTFLASIPLEDVMRSPSFQAVFGNVFNNIPVVIPPAMATALERYMGADFFDGIVSFSDLKRRIDLFLWRARKTLAATTYAERGERQARKLLDTIDVYLDIIETINTEGLTE